jgi:hypothetical protein
MLLVAYMEYKLWAKGYAIPPFEYEEWLAWGRAYGEPFTLCPGYWID